MSGWHMTLGEVIDFLREQDPATPVADGFGRATSYRGHYDRIAFLPLANTTIGAMLAEAEKADGAVYGGYKGGEYRMDRRTLCHVAEWGRCPDGDELTLRRLHDMASPPAVVSLAELSALRAIAQAAGRVVEWLKKVQGTSHDFDRLREHHENLRGFYDAVSGDLATALSALPPARPGNGEGEG